MWKSIPQQKPISVSGQPFYKFDGQEKTRQNPKTAVAWTPHSRAGRQILLNVAVSEQTFSMFEYTFSDITATFNHRRICETKGREVGNSNNTQDRTHDKKQQNRALNATFWCKCTWSTPQPQSGGRRPTFNSASPPWGLRSTPGFAAFCQHRHLKENSTVRCGKMENAHFKQSERFLSWSVRLNFLKVLMRWRLYFHF